MQVGVHDHPTGICTSLLDLPVEVLVCVLKDLVPTDKLISVSLRGPGNQSPQGRSLLSGRVNEIWSQRPRFNRSSAPDGLLQLLLIHPTIYYLVRDRLYSRNTFWFHDVHSLRCFVEVLSPRTKVAVRSVFISEWQVVREQASERVVRRWFDGPELGIADAIRNLTGLRELTLSDIWRGRPQLLEHELMGAEDTYYVRARNLWKMNLMELVARIIRLEMDDLSEGLEHEGRESQGQSAMAEGPLVGGKVSNVGERSPEVQHYRLRGIRIIKSGVQVDMEPEVVDVDVLESWREAKALYEEKTRQIEPSEIARRTWRARNRPQN